MPEFVYVIRPPRPEMPNDPTPEESAILAEHFAYPEALTARGVLVLVGRAQEENSVGIAIFRAHNEAEARASMLHDPAPQHGVMHATHHPFRITLSSTRA